MKYRSLKSATSLAFINLTRHSLYGVSSTSSTGIFIASRRKSIELSSAILKAASGKGFVDLEAVELLAMKELASSDEVDPKEVAKVIDKLAKDKPYLIKGENTAAPGSGNFEKSNQEPAKDVDSMMRDFLHS